MKLCREGLFERRNRRFKDRKPGLNGPFQIKFREGQHAVDEGAEKVPGGPSVESKIREIREGVDGTEVQGN